MQARLFSYLDTQLTRLGGPNFTQLPINRPHAAGQRHAARRDAPDGGPRGVAPYRPNSLDGGCPFLAGADDGALRRRPAAVAGAKVRAQPASLRRPLLPGPAVLAEHDRGRAASTSSRPTPSSSASATSRRSSERQLAVPRRTSTPTCVRRSPPASACRRRSATVASTWRRSPVPRCRRSDGRARRTGEGRRSSSTRRANPRRSPRSSPRREAARLIPFVVSLTGGVVADATVDRTYGTARSFEFDALVLGGALAPAADATPAWTPGRPPVSPATSMAWTRGSPDRRRDVASLQGAGRHRPGRDQGAGVIGIDLGSAGSSAATRLPRSPTSSWHCSPCTACGTASPHPAGDPKQLTRTCDRHRSRAKP